MWSDLNEHRHYLADSRRLAAYAAALQALVRPTDIVLDLGCGTGVLGLLACRAGARHVYSVDATDMIDLAREVVRANGLTSRITTIRGLSTSLSLPTPVDVVVADQLGGLGFEAGVFSYYADARRRLLAADGRFVPAALALSVAPVEAPEVYADIDCWDNPWDGISCTPIRRIAANVLHPFSLDAGQLLADAVTTEPIDPSRHAGALRISGTVGVARPGVLHGLGGWFTASLAATVSMSNAPHDPLRIARRNTFLPLETPVRVDAGARVTMDVRLDPASGSAAWRVRAEHANGHVDEARHSTVESVPLSRDKLADLGPGATPRLDVRRRAERDVLVLCDGAHTTAAIETHLSQEYPSLFPTSEAAALFVTRTLHRTAL